MNRAGVQTRGAAARHFSYAADAAGADLLLRRQHSERRPVPKGQFIIPSLAPLVYNIAIILGGVLLSCAHRHTGFAVGVLGGAIVGNFLLQIYGAYRAGAIYLPNFNVRHPGFWMFLKLSVPIMLALGLAFVDDWIIR